MFHTDSVDTTGTVPRVEPEPSRAPWGKKRWLTWPHVALLGVLLVSVAMYFYQLGKNGYSSYYPAAIRSMMDNWHNFFFAAYDPGGFVSIDKPPVGFWLDVVSAKNLRLQCCEHPAALGAGRGALGFAAVPSGETPFWGGRRLTRSSGPGRQSHQHPDQSQHHD